MTAGWAVIEERRKALGRKPGPSSEDLANNLNNRDSATIRYVRRHMPEMDDYTDDDLVEEFQPQNIGPPKPAPGPSWIGPTIATIRASKGKRPGPGEDQIRESFKARDPEMISYVRRHIPDLPERDEDVDKIFDTSPAPERTRASPEQARRLQIARSRERSALAIKPYVENEVKLRRDSAVKGEENKTIPAVRGTMSLGDNVRGIRAPTTLFSESPRVWSELLLILDKHPELKAVNAGSTIQVQDKQGRTVWQPESPFFEVPFGAKNKDGTPVYTSGWKQGVAALSGQSDPKWQYALSAARHPVDSAQKLMEGRPGDILIPGYGPRAAAIDAGDEAFKATGGVDPNQAVNGKGWRPPFGGERVKGRHVAAAIAAGGSAFDRLQQGAANLAGNWADPATDWHPDNLKSRKPLVSEALEGAPGWSPFPWTDASEKLDAPPKRKFGDWYRSRAELAEGLYGIGDSNKKEAEQGWEMAKDLAVNEQPELPDNPESRKALIDAAAETAGSLAQIQANPGIVDAIGTVAGPVARAVAPSIKNRLWNSHMKNSPDAMKLKGWLSANPATAMSRPEQQASLDVMEQAIRNKAGTAPEVGQANAFDVLERTIKESRVPNPHRIQDFSTTVPGRVTPAKEQMTANPVLHKPPTVEPPVKLGENEVDPNQISLSMTTPDAPPPVRPSGQTWGPGMTDPTPPPLMTESVPTPEANEWQSSVDRWAAENAAKKDTRTVPVETPESAARNTQYMDELTNSGTGFADPVQQSLMPRESPPNLLKGRPAYTKEVPPKSLPSRQTREFSQEPQQLEILQPVDTASFAGGKPTGAPLPPDAPRGLPTQQVDDNAAAVWDQRPSTKSDRTSLGDMASPRWTKGEPSVQTASGQKDWKARGEYYDEARGTGHADPQQQSILPRLPERPTKEYSQVPYVHETPPPGGQSTIDLITPDRPMPDLPNSPMMTVSVPTPAKQGWDIAKERWSAANDAKLASEKAPPAPPAAPWKADPLDIPGAGESATKGNAPFFTKKELPRINPDPEVAEKTRYSSWYGGKQYGPGMDTGVVDELRKNKEIILSFAGDNKHAGSQDFTKTARQMLEDRVLYIPDLPRQSVQAMNGKRMDERSAMSLAYALSEHSRYRKVDDVASWMDDIMATSGNARMQTSGAFGFQPRQVQEDYTLMLQNSPGAGDKSVRENVAKIVSGKGYTGGKGQAYSNAEIYRRVQEGGTLHRSASTESAAAAGATGGRSGPVIPGVRAAQRWVTKQGGKPSKILKAIDDAGTGLADAMSAPAEATGKLSDAAFVADRYPGLDPSFNPQDAIKLNMVSSDIRNGATLDEAISNLKRGINYGRKSGIDRIAKTVIPYWKYNSGMYPGAIGGMLRNPGAARMPFNASRIIEAGDTAANGNEPINQKLKDQRGMWATLAGYPLLGGGTDEAGREKLLTIRAPTIAGAASNQGEMFNASLSDDEAPGRGAGGLANSFIQNMGALGTGKNSMRQNVSGLTPDVQKNVLSQADPGLESLLASAIPGFEIPQIAARLQTDPNRPSFSNPDLMMGDTPNATANMASWGTVPFTAPFVNSQIGRQLSRFALPNSGNPARQTSAFRGDEGWRTLAADALGIRALNDDTALMGSRARDNAMRKVPKNMQDLLIQGVLNGTVRP